MADAISNHAAQPEHMPAAKRMPKRHAPLRAVPARQEAVQVRRDRTQAKRMPQLDRHPTPILKRHVMEADAGFTDREADTGFTDSVFTDLRGVKYHVSQDA